MPSPVETAGPLLLLCLLLVLQATSPVSGQRHQPLVPPSITLGLGGSGSAPLPATATFSETIERGTDDKIQVNDPMCGIAPVRYRRAEPEPEPEPELREATEAPGELQPIRIVGGLTAEVGRFPWLVGVTNFFSKVPFCGGALINERFVVTAAHCLRGRSPITLAVLVNKHLRKDDKQEVKFAIAEIIRHPDYSRETLTDDLALLKLKDPKGELRDLLLSGTLRPICLPEEPCEGTGRPACLLDRDVTIAGWGSLAEEGAKPTALQFATVTVLPNSLCEDAYQKIDITVNDHMICAGRRDGSADTCQGDSGGPMMLDIDGKVTLGGIVSFGKGCASPDYPGVYVRVSEFTRWIIQESRV